MRRQRNLIAAAAATGAVCLLLGLVPLTASAGTIAWGVALRGTVPWSPPETPETGIALAAGNYVKLAATTQHRLLAGYELQILYRKVPSVGPAGTWSIRQTCSSSPCLFSVTARSALVADFYARVFHVTATVGPVADSNRVTVVWHGASPSIVGTWTWSYGPSEQTLTINGSVTFNKNGTMTWTGGSGGTWNLIGTVATLTWTSGPSKGSVDTLTVSSDQDSMSGHNKSGTYVVGTRQ